MKEINLPDKLRKVAFIEYLLWKYRKSLQELFAPPEVPPEALEALEKAINEYERVFITHISAIHQSFIHSFFIL